MKRNMVLTKMFGVTLTAVMALTSCRSVPSVDYKKMAPAARGQNPQILNLKMLDRRDNPLYQQEEKLMRNGFLDSSTEEYGYYYIYYRHMWDTDISADTLWLFLHIMTLGTSILFGAPTGIEDERITVYLDIYNSLGEKIKTFQKDTGIFTLYAGLYYGYNPEKNVEKRISKLFTDIQKNAAAEIVEINRMLREAGPISALPDDFDFTVKVQKKLVDDPYSLYSHSSGNSNSSETTPSAPAAPSTPTLRQGTYQLSGSSAEFSFAGIGSSGFCTLKNDTGTASGQYSINGNRITINIAGKTFYYTITGNDSFSGNGETWVRTGF